MKLWFKHYLYGLVLSTIIIADAFAQWQPLDLTFGYGNSVKHMFIDSYSGDLIMTGVITAVNDEAPYASVARWNGQQLTGLSGPPNADWVSWGGNVLDGVSYGGKIFIGGAFPNGLEGSSHLHLAIWDTSGAWEAPQPIYNAVEAITIIDSILYFAVSTDGGGLNPTCFYTYEGSTWDSISIEIPSTGVGGFFSAGMIRFQNHYFCGGNFHIPEGDDLFEWLGGDEFVAVWPGQPGPGFISEMLVYNGELIVSGSFTEALGNLSNCVAAYDGTDWRPLYNNSGFERVGFSPAILDLLVHDGILYAIGAFDSVDGQEANDIAWWDGNQWHGMGDERFSSLMCGEVYRDTLYVSGRLYLDTLGSRKYVGKYLGELPSNPNSVRELDSEINQSIYPNPTNSTTTITWHSQDHGNYELTLFDVLGKQVLRHSGTATTGNNTLRIDMSTYAKGIYFGRLFVGEETDPFGSAQGRAFKVVRE